MVNKQSIREEIERLEHRYDRLDDTGMDTSAITLEIEQLQQALHALENKGEKTCCLI